MTVLISLALALCSSMSPVVHSVTDVSQRFTFYMDGRFYRQYLKPEARDVRNWGSLSELDLSNVNLLILTAGDPRIPYASSAIEKVNAFMKSGGTVLVMADGLSGEVPISKLLDGHGMKLSGQRAKAPLKGMAELSGHRIVYRGGSPLEPDESWGSLVVDEIGRPVLAERAVGDGTLVVGSRGLFGHKPDASDPINDEWVGPMLVSRAIEKTIDPNRPHRRTWAEDSRMAGPLKLEYHDGTERFADGILEVYEEVRPHLLAITGVEPSPGMIKRLLILPTGGGGFSSGVCIAIGAWWGGFPEKRYPMVELVSHEAGHSWVLPHAEPLWNEPIATWFGIEVGRRMGMSEAQQRLERQIGKARKLDPDLTKLNPMDAEASRDLVWGKSYHVFEELERLHGPGAMAKYFRAKREHISPERAAYTMDDCVAVWSLAVEQDLFPWFRSLAFDVDRSRTELPAP